MTTYADLLAQTTEHVREGANQLAMDRFWTPHEALDAIGDYYGLLDAIASHTRRLLWPAQLGRIGLTRHREGLPPIERAAIDLVAAIESITGASRPHPSQISTPRSPWAHASLTLRAAGDLLATHYGPGGQPRTPDAAHATTASFDAGLAGLGHLTRTVLAHEEPLALRAIQAGVPRGLVARHLPGLEQLAELTRGLESETPRPSKAHLDVLGQVPPRRRGDDPAADLADRMIRLRQATWELTGERSDALASLRTMAGLGVAVHAHAAAFYGANLVRPDAAGRVQGADGLVRRARTWQRLHQALSQFAVLAPPTASIREDAFAAATLLGHLAPIDHGAAAAPLSSADRRIGQAINGAVQVMADIAVHEGATFDRLARTHLLYIPAKALPRELVSEQPALAIARLEHRVVQAPDAATGRAARLYTEVAAHPIGALEAVHAARRAPAPAGAALLISSGPQRQP
jgi:hypothetical protein